jgi:hypothetical protein
VQAGDIKYQNINGYKLIDDAERVKIGSPYFPTATYSLNVDFNYKGFDVKLLLQGVAGSEINILDVNNLTVPYANNNNAYTLFQDRWAYYPDPGVDPVR